MKRCARCKAPAAGVVQIHLRGKMDPYRAPVCKDCADLAKLTLVPPEVFDAQTKLFPEGGRAPRGTPPPTAVARSKAKRVAVEGDRRVHIGCGGDVAGAYCMRCLRTVPPELVAAPGPPRD